MYVEKEKYLASRSPLLGEKGEVEERERKGICNLADVTKKNPEPYIHFSKYRCFGVLMLSWQSIQKFYSVLTITKKVSFSADSFLQTNSLEDSFLLLAFLLFFGKNPIEGLSQKRGTYVDTRGLCRILVLVTAQFPWK